MNSIQHTNIKASLLKLKPGVERQWHLFLSGVVWSGAGIMLISLAVGWILESDQQQVVLPFVVGGAIAWAIYRFGFSKIADKNIQRITRMIDKVCVFAFQEWRSYAIMIFMMTLGSTLRRSGFPKTLLAPMYIGIGGGLFLSSLRYYVQLKREMLVDSRKPVK